MFMRSGGPQFSHILESKKEKKEKHTKKYPFNFLINDTYSCIWFGSFELRIWGMCYLPDVEIAESGQKF